MPTKDDDLMPTLAQMAALCAIAESGGIVAAEREGRGDRSNLSAQAKSMSELVRSELYGAGGLTEDGRLLYNRIKQGTGLIKDTVLALRQKARPAATIGSHGIVTDDILPGMLHELKRQHPNLHCATDSANEAELRQWLHNGHITVAIAAGSPDWHGCRHVPLLSLEPCFVYQRKSGKLGEDFLRGRHTIAEPIYYSAASAALFERFVRTFRRLGVSHPEVQQLASARCVAREVAASGGFGLLYNLPVLVAQPGLRAVNLPMDAVPFCAFYRNKMTWEIEAAIAAMKKLAGEMAARPAGARTHGQHRDRAEAREEICRGKG